MGAVSSCKLECEYSTSAGIQIAAIQAAILYSGLALQTIKMSP